MVDVSTARVSTRLGRASLLFVAQPFFRWPMLQLATVPTMVTVALDCNGIRFVLATRDNGAFVETVATIGRQG